jgi:hypothetical protein
VDKVAACSDMDFFATEKERQTCVHEFKAGGSSYLSHAVSRSPTMVLQHDQQTATRVLLVCNYGGQERALWCGVEDWRLTEGPWWLRGEKSASLGSCSAHALEMDGFV